MLQKVKCSIIVYLVWASSGGGGLFPTGGIPAWIYSNKLNSGPRGISDVAR
jgi:hypothetical protein